MELRIKAEKHGRNDRSEGREELVSLARKVSPGCSIDIQLLAPRTT
jgi:hypothetical protein